MSLLSLALAVVGALVFSLALTIPGPSVARTAGDPVDREPLGDAGLLDIDEAASHLEIGLASLPASPAEPPPPPPPPRPVVVPRAAPAVLAVTSVPSGMTVIASWYGPGFYGNRTACGQVYTPEIMGVAHRTLPCGTMLRLQFGDSVVTVPVIDRGPFIEGRTLDLSNATRAALGCTDLCPVRMH